MGTVVVWSDWSQSRRKLEGEEEEGGEVGGQGLSQLPHAVAEHLGSLCL